MYSLGVILFELTFGRQPYFYATASVEERLQAHQFQPVQFPKEWPETVPAAWRAVLERLLTKKPENRYDSYDKLLRAIDLAQPLKLPPASLFQRGLAWLLDTAILAAYVAFFAAAERLFPTKNAWDAELPGLQFLPILLSVGAALAVPIFAILLYCKWGATPGKKLFQLRVVDPHGQSPSRPRFALRTVMPFLLVWNLSANAILAAFFDIILMLENSEHLQFMKKIEIVPQATAFLLLALSGLMLLVEVGCALFSKKRIALHDRLFCTRVTLDTRHSSDTK